MEYRTEWLKHAGLMTRHLEIVLTAYSREIPDRPLSMLNIGVENGGSLEVWGKVLPEGSRIVGMDNDPACLELGLDVLLGDVTNKNQMTELLRGEWFDVIIDSTGTMSVHPWVFLRPGGVYVYEGFHPAMASRLVEDLSYANDSWLPIEEVIRATIWQGVLVVEKRNPTVVPYVEVMIGNFAEVVSEEELKAQGVRQVLVE
jgi:hypothetical protein